MRIRIRQLGGHPSQLFFCEFKGTLVRDSVLDVRQMAIGEGKVSGIAQACMWAFECMGHQYKERCPYRSDTNFMLGHENAVSGSHKLSATAHPLQFRR
jgi:hypothetical protein